jgi:hypothetical protein
MGGIISAWNMRVVVVLARVWSASDTSEEETAGNSSTWLENVSIVNEV